MAAINQITIAGGSTYDVNDKRITTSAVSTATHFLATDSSISSIAPITAANLASVLGVSVSVGSFTGAIPQDSYYIQPNVSGGDPFYIAVNKETQKLYVLCKDTGVLSVQLTL